MSALHIPSVCATLNVLIRKLDVDHQGNETEVAMFILAELAKEEITGIAWDASKQQFIPETPYDYRTENPAGSP